MWKIVIVAGVAAFGLLVVHQAEAQVEHVDATMETRGESSSEDALLSSAALDVLNGEALDDRQLYALDQALVTFGGSQSLRERLAKLVWASTPAQS